MAKAKLPPFHPRSGETPERMSLNSFRAAFPLESDYVERKRGLSGRQIQRAIVAFSNSDGGVVLIGVEDDGQLLGRALTQGVIDTIHESALAAHNPGRYWIHDLTVDSLPMTVLAVERRSQGFSQTSDGQILVRRGGKSIPLFGGDLQRLISERAIERFDVTDSGVVLSAADPALLAEVQRIYRWSRPPSIERLIECGLALPANGQSHLTISGVLSLLSEPSKRLGKAYVKILRFPSEGVDYDRRVEIKGPIQQQVVDATEFVMEELGTDLVVSGLRRHELPKLPEVVVREAIANAVAHRTYEEVGRAIRIELRPDRVIVVSPGGLPEPVTEQNIREAQSARNTTVLGLLRRHRLAEDIGRGVDVMQDSMAEALLDPPRFHDHGHSVQVILPIRGAISPQERAWVLEVERRGLIQPRERIVLVQAARGDVLTNARVRELLSVDSRDARLALRRLRGAGLLEQIGTHGGTSYVLSRSLGAPASFRMSLAELKRFVLDLALKGPITNRMVRTATGLDRAETLRVLESLVRDKRLRRTGERRGSRYTLVTRSKA